MAERKAFLLRIDPQLWAELEAWAESELRSVNGQIEFLLREAASRRRGRSRPRTEPPPGPASSTRPDRDGTPDGT